MTGLSSPAAMLVSLPARVATPSVTAPAPTLAAFTDQLAKKVQEQSKDDRPADTERQDDADSGKSLPDKDSDTLDPALAWLFGAQPLIAPKPVTVAAPVPTGPSATAPVVPAPVALDPAAILAATPSPVAPPVTAALLPAVTPDAGPASAFVLPDAATLAPPADVPTAETPKPTQPAKIVLPPALQPIAAALTPTANVPLPALFALAMNVDRPTGGEDKNTPSLTLGAATLLQPTDAAALIAKTGGAQGQALDLGRQDWPQKMIDHIEALRDGANANDTSIRLKPEALGRVDIALRTHTDGAISVRFTAEQPTTRTILADAAPQLSAAADAKGIRLAGTSVDLSGSGANDERQRALIERRQNITNTLADSGEDDLAVDDGRIA